MEVFNIKNLSFSYNGAEEKALNEISLRVNEGEMLLIIGESGCGKTTLLKMLKKELTPRGKLDGEILFMGGPLEKLTPRESAEKIGYLMQETDFQLVTDRVYSELAFGPESLGVSKEIIRARVAEFASCFGLSELFSREVNTLSGGQKQLLNLASVMLTGPGVIILDEPLSQLDPISSVEFINTVRRINRELGTTVIIAEHHLEEVFSLADRVVYMENGRIADIGRPGEICSRLADKRIGLTLPAPARVFNGLRLSGSAPLTVKEGRELLRNHSFSDCAEASYNSNKEITLRAKNLFFRYEKNGSDVLRGLDFSAAKGAIYAVAGENGSGKSTLLRLLSGELRAYRGKVENKNRTAYLPQNPRDAFVRDSLKDDFSEINNSYLELCERFGIVELLNRHPYDLSGGELQRAAIVKCLLTSPEVLLLDEPTKGLDSFSKRGLGELLREIAAGGVTVVIVTHDLEFAACYSDHCGLLFDGLIISQLPSRRFFRENTFYTPPPWFSGSLFSAKKATPP